MREFQGITTALVTPMTPDKKLDLAALNRLVAFQLEAGINNLLACGSTGEGFLLNPDEYNQVLKCVLQEAGSKVPVMAAASGFSVEHILKLAKDAEDLGAHAILTAAPPYLKPQQRGLFEFFKEIHDQLSIPLFIYDHPTRTGSTMSETLLRELMELPRINGIKDATNNLEKLKNLRRYAKKDFLLLSGNDDNLWSYYELGGNGLISATSNFAPKVFVNHYKAFASGVQGPEYENLTKLTEQVAALAFLEANPVPSKEALAIMGIIGATVRKPYINMSEENKTYLKQGLEQFKLYPESFVASRTANN